MRGKTLVIISLVLVCLALAVVPGCKASTYDMAHKQEAPSYDAGFVIDNPAPIGYTVEKLIDLSVTAGEDMPTEASMHTIEVTVKEFYRGDEAWKLLQEADASNQPPPEGYDYIVVKIGLNFWAAAATTRWFLLFEYIIERTQWKAYNADGTVYEPADVMPPEPIMRYHMVAGDKREGWMAFMVPKDDPKPVMRLVRDNLWFMLYEN
jgi:hypothetical protein